MSFNTALTSGQKTAIRAASVASDWLVTFCSNEVLCAGTVQTDLSSQQAWAQFAYTVTAGFDYLILPDMAILIGTENDITKATYRGAMREVPSGGLLKVSESSQDFPIGSYFWVLWTYDPTYWLSRPDDNHVEKVKYNVGYAAPQPMGTGLRLAYVDYVSSVTGKMRVAFNVSGYVVDPGTTISSYQFIFKTGFYTVVSGSLLSPTVTIDFDPGEQWGLVYFFCSNGQTKARHIYINAHDDDHPPFTAGDNISIVGDISRGYTLGVTAFADVDDLLEKTLAVVWRRNELSDGVITPFSATNNIQFCGWVQSENDTDTSDLLYSVLSDAAFLITGIGPQMMRLSAQLLPFILSTDPSVWGELKLNTPWRAICHFLSRYTTISNLVDIEFSSRDETYLFPDLSSLGGNVFAVVDGLAKLIKCELETGPDGRIEINQRADKSSAVERAALPTIMDYETQDVISISRALERPRTVGKVDSTAAVYNSVNGQVSVFTARAPGFAQGEAAGSGNLPSEILASTSNMQAAIAENCQRVGDEYEIENNNEVVDVEHPDSFIFPVPSRAELYTLTLPATVAGTNGVNRMVYTTATKWLCEGVSFSRPGNGTTGVRIRYRVLSRVGDPGMDTTELLVLDGEIDPAVDYIGDPPYDFEDPEVIYPEDGLDTDDLPITKVPTYIGNGEELLVWSEDQAFFLRQFLARQSPLSTEITPPDLAAFLIAQGLVDPASNFKTSVGGYLQVSDSTNSKTLAAPNILATRPLWAEGEEVTGIYNVIRATKNADNVLIYAPGDEPTEWSHTFDFSIDEQGFSAFGGVRATYVPGSYWSSVDIVITTDRRICEIEINFTSSVFTSAAMTYDRTGSGTQFGDVVGASINIGSFVKFLYMNQCIDGTDLVLSGTSEGDPSANIRLTVQSSHTSYGGIARIKKLVVTGNTPNPFGPDGVGARVRLSTDGGQTYGAFLVVGDSPGSIGGFDVQRAGNVSYAGAANEVCKATALGGTYSSWVNCTGANVVACIIPYFIRNSTTVKNTTTSTPDVIVALDQDDSDSGALYWIAGATGVKTDITPVSGMTFDNPNCITVSYGTHIAVFGLVGGVYKLYTSTDGGSTWTFRTNLTTPGFIRTRRSDTRAKAGGNRGQLYVTNGDAVSYSNQWAGGGIWPRTMPVAGMLGLETLW